MMMQKISARRDYFVMFGVLLIMGGVTVIIPAGALTSPITENQAKNAGTYTNDRVGVAVDQPANGKQVGVGFGSSGHDASASGGSVGAAYGGDGGSNQNGGNAVANGGIVGLAQGGAGGSNSDCNGARNGGQGTATGGTIGVGLGGAGGSSIC